MAYDIERRLHRRRTDVGDVDELTEVLDPALLQARSRVGHVLDGKWRLDVLLGVGGMAAVYAATHRNGNRAAIKLLHHELATSHEVRSRFLREGYIANAVGHEGTVRVLDDDIDEEGAPFLVVELLDGETLEERRIRAGGALSEDEVLCITDRILDVLIAAHDKDIVHRDLKPENIFVERSGQVRVLDFGIARLRAASTASTATQTGAAMGTPAYMPPEQARGLWDHVDARSDLWAVGATMYTALSGALPHGGRTPNESLLSAMANEVPRLASVAPSVHPSVARLVDRAVSFDRERRWPSARRMQEVLREVYHDRHRVPITTAPRLRVPAEVPNRTVSSSPGVVAPSLPTTGQPVASGSRAPVARWRLRSPAVLAGTGVATGALVVGIWLAASMPSQAPSTEPETESVVLTTPSLAEPMQSFAAATVSTSPQLPPAASTPVPVEPATLVPEAAGAPVASPGRITVTPQPLAAPPPPRPKRDPLAP